MDIFKKYIVITTIAIVIVILFVFLIPIDWNEIKTPLEIRMNQVQNCIDNLNLTNSQCMDKYPVDTVMTRPIINITGGFD